MYEASNAVEFFDMVGKTEWNQDLQRTLVHWIGIRDLDEVLDVGCGAGHFVLRLAQRAQAVTGLDSSAEMVRLAGLQAEDNQVKNTEFALGSVTNLPVPSERFDLVTVVNLLFMFRRLDAPIAELLRVLRPQGQIIVLDPSDALNPWAAQNYCDEHNLRDFERESLLSFATAAARFGPIAASQFTAAVENAHGRVVDTALWMGGLVRIYRIVHAGL